MYSHAVIRFRVCYRNLNALLFQCISMMRKTLRCPLFLVRWDILNRHMKWKSLYSINKTSSIHCIPKYQIKNTRDFFFTSASKEYKNWSANKRAQCMPIVIPSDCWNVWLPKTTKILSMRNSSVALISTSEYLCVKSEWSFGIADHYVWIFPFSNFNSTEPKVQVGFSDRLLSVVCP